MYAIVKRTKQLDLLRDRVLLLGGKTEDAVSPCGASLTERNTDLAKSVCTRRRADRPDGARDRSSEHRDLGLAAANSNTTCVSSFRSQRSPRSWNGSPITRRVSPRLRSFSITSRRWRAMSISRSMAEIAARMLRAASQRFHNRRRGGIAARSSAATRSSIKTTAVFLMGLIGTMVGTRAAGRMAPRPAAVCRKAYRAHRRLRKGHLRAECLPE